eukprot:CAMPEP_0179374882 /NCGR_PEP_ID=MMETSP0797-20121207/87526_1 /TAXON_ID=47934 /ORGANISM="Dinophysis acuminata, Strain DAEP01" /LENGTH=726 /DNA_ID=CAMNT_0021090891 /DNA_START=1 /DNA_END=2179 /DNA_ORIENTATION=+
MPVVGSVDVLQQACMTATASSVASYAVDGVVKEALRFFEALQHASPAGHGPDGGEERFAVFKQHAHEEAFAASKACALAHQLAAHDPESNGRTGGSGLTSAMALAAGRVGHHAGRLAVTAREAAGLCMGILEKAVQVSASALARESAKRCGEQALVCIEAAIAAEQHNRSLNELLQIVMSNEYQTGSTAAASSAPPGAGVAAGATPALAESQNENLWVDSMAATPFALAADPGKCRWWDAGPDAVVAMAQLAPPPPPKSGLRAAHQPPFEVAKAGTAGTNTSLVQDDAEQLAQYLKRRAQVCAGIASSFFMAIDLATVMGLPEAEKKKMIAHYGPSSTGGMASLWASSAAEEAILDDDEVARLAYWRNPLAAALFEPVRCRNAEQLHGLVVALQGATREAPDKQAAVCAPSAKSALPSRARSSAGDIFAQAGDWDSHFDRLNWVTPGHKQVQQLDTDAAVASILNWQANSVAKTSERTGTLEGSPYAAEEEWSVDTMTLRKLQEMAMHSRVKQRLQGITKHKAHSEDRSPPMGGGCGGFGNAGAAGEDDPQEVQELLRRLLGDLVVLPDDIRPNGHALGVGNTGAMAKAAASRTQASKKRGGRKKKKPGVPSSPSAQAVDAETLMPDWNQYTPGQFLQHRLDAYCAATAGQDEDAWPSMMPGMPADYFKTPTPTSTPPRSFIVDATGPHPDTPEFAVMNDPSGPVYVRAGAMQPPMPSPEANQSRW